MRISKFFTGALFFTLAACSSPASFQAERMTVAQGDEMALEITDEWVMTDTQNAVADILEQMNENRSFREYLAHFQGKPKLFVGEIKNDTGDAYFPIDDLTDEFLTGLSKTGDYILIEKDRRDALLEEITFQNDGMVDMKEAKEIGRMSGADLIVFGVVHENSESLEGKTIREYSVNLHMTDIEKGHEVLRARYTASKYSKRSPYGW